MKSEQSLYFSSFAITLAKNIYDREETWNKKEACQTVYLGESAKDGDTPTFV